MAALTLDRIIPEAMYDTAVAGQLMGGLSREAVCQLIKDKKIRGYKRPPVRGNPKASRKRGRHQLAVPGKEIIRFNQSMEPATPQTQIARELLVVDGATRRRSLPSRQRPAPY